MGTRNRQRLINFRYSPYLLFQYGVMRTFKHIVITLAISFILCLSGCSAAESAEIGRSKFGVYIVRSPETTIAPTGDEVVLECGLNVNPDRIIWRFLPQNASKVHRRNFRIIESSSVSEANGSINGPRPIYYGQLCAPPSIAVPTKRFPLLCRLITTSR